MSPKRSSVCLRHECTRAGDDSYCSGKNFDLFEGIWHYSSSFSNLFSFLVYHPPLIVLPHSATLLGPHLLVNNIRSDSPRHVFDFLHSPLQDYISLLLDGGAAATVTTVFFVLLPNEISNSWPWAGFSTYSLLLHVRIQSTNQSNRNSIQFVPRAVQ